MLYRCVRRLSPLTFDTHITVLPTYSSLSLYRLDIAFPCIQQEQRTTDVVRIVLTHFNRFYIFAMTSPLCHFKTAPTTSASTAVAYNTGSKVHTVPLYAIHSLAISQWIGLWHRAQVRHRRRERESHTKNWNETTSNNNKNNWKQNKANANMKARAYTLTHTLSTIWVLKRGREEIQRNGEKKKWNS